MSEHVTLIAYNGFLSLSQETAVSLNFSMEAIPSSHVSREDKVGVGLRRSVDAAANRSLHVLVVRRGWSRTCSRPLTTVPSTDVDVASVELGADNDDEYRERARLQAAFPASSESRAAMSRVLPN